MCISQEGQQLVPAAALCARGCSRHLLRYLTGTTQQSFKMDSSCHPSVSEETTAWGQVSGRWLKLSPAPYPQLLRTLHLQQVLVRHAGCMHSRGRLECPLSADTQHSLPAGVCSWPHCGPLLPLWVCAC